MPQKWGSYEIVPRPWILGVPIAGGHQGNNMLFFNVLLEVSESHTEIREAVRAAREAREAKALRGRPEI